MVMKLHNNKNKCFLFVIYSWLIAKLWWSFEISRLAFFRDIDKKKVITTIESSSILPISYWSYDNSRMALLNYDKTNGVFIFYKLNEFSKN